MDALQVAGQRARHPESQMPPWFRDVYLILRCCSGERLIPAAFRALGVPWDAPSRTRWGQVDAVWEP